MPLAALAPPLAAQTAAAPEPEKCVEIGAPADRLACYDKAMGRAAAPAEPPGYAENPAGGAPASTSLLAPKDSAVPVAAQRKDSASLMSRLLQF